MRLVHSSHLLTIPSIYFGPYEVTRPTFLQLLSFYSCPDVSHAVLLIHTPAPESESCTTRFPTKYTPHAMMTPNVLSNMTSSSSSSHSFLSSNIIFFTRQSKIKKKKKGNDMPYTSLYSFNNQRIALTYEKFSEPIPSIKVIVWVKC